MKAHPYHHGSLRQALLDHAVDAISETGPAGLSLRDLARRAGVSYAAPTHHFGDKAGLLTALAAQGYNLLADDLAAAQQRTGEFLEVGVAYVRFATERRAHFEVMFRPDLIHPGDQTLQAAKRRTQEALRSGISDLSDAQAGADIRLAAVAAWSMVHGFATLWLNGALPAEIGDDPEVAARAAAALLFRAP